MNLMGYRTIIEIIHVTKYVCIYQDYQTGLKTVPLKGGNETAPLNF